MYFNTKVFLARNPLDNMGFITARVLAQDA